MTDFVLRIKYSLCKVFNESMRSLTLLLFTALLLAQSYLLTIHNPNSYDLKDFQVKVKLPDELKGKPISVYDTSNNPIPFCYETSVGECTTDYTQGDGYIWIKVPFISANGDTKLIVSVGSNGAVKGDEVFDFYDDFNEGHLDATKWVTANEDGYDEPNPEFEDGYIKLIPDGDHPWNKIRTRQMIDLKDRIIEVRKKIDGSSNTYWWNYYSTEIQYDDGDSTLCDSGVCTGDNVGWGTGCSWGAFQVFAGTGSYACINEKDKSEDNGGTHCCDGEPVEEGVWYLQRDLILSNSTVLSFIETEDGKKAMIGMEYSIDRGYINFLCEYHEPCLADWIRVRKYAERPLTYSFKPYSTPALEVLGKVHLPHLMIKFLKPALIVEEVYRKALASKGLILTFLETSLVKVMKEMSRITAIEFLTASLYSKYKNLEASIVKLNETISNINLQELNLTLVYDAFNYLNEAEEGLADFNFTYNKIKGLINSLSERSCKANATKTLLELLESSKSLPKFIKAQTKVKKEFGSVDNLLECLVREGEAGLKRNFKYLEAWVKSKMSQVQDEINNLQAALEVLVNLVIKK